MPDDKKKKKKLSEFNPEDIRVRRPGEKEESSSSFGQIFKDVVLDTQKLLKTVVATNPATAGTFYLYEKFFEGDKPNYVEDVLVPQVLETSKNFSDATDKILSGGAKSVEGAMQLGNLLAHQPFYGFEVQDKALRHYGMETYADAFSFPFTLPPKVAREGVKLLDKVLPDKKQQNAAIRLGILAFTKDPELAHSFDDETLQGMTDQLQASTDFLSILTAGGVTHKAGGVGKQIGKKFQKKLPVNVDPLGKEGRLGLGVEETALVRPGDRIQPRPLITPESVNVIRTLTQNRQVRLGTAKLDRGNAVNERLSLNEKIKSNRQRVKNLKDKTGKDVIAEKKRLKQETKEAIIRRKELDEIVDYRNKEIDSYKEPSKKEIKIIKLKETKDATQIRKEELPIDKKTSQVEVKTEAKKEEVTAKEKIESEGLVFEGIQKTKQGDFYTISTKDKKVTRLIKPEELDKGIKQIKEIEQAQTNLRNKSSEQLIGDFVRGWDELYKFERGRGKITENDKIRDALFADGGARFQAARMMAVQGLERSIQFNKFHLTSKSPYYKKVSLRNPNIGNKEYHQKQIKLAEDLLETLEILSPKKGRPNIDRLNQLNVMFDPTVLVDMAKVGAELVGKGYKSFGKWADEMKRTYGEEISPHLVKLWDMSKVVVRETKDKERVSKQTSEKKFATEKEVLEYRKIYIKRNSPLSKTKESIKETGESLGKTGRQILKPLDTRLREIDPALYRTVKLNDHIKETKIRAEEEIASKLVKPKGKFLKKTMDSKDVADLDLAFKQENEVKIREIVKKYGLTKELSAVINLLNKVGKELGINKEGFYFPRMVRDYKGYVTEVYKILNKEPQVKGILDKVLDEYASKKGSKLTVEEEAHIINNAIRGYIPGITLSKFANEFARTVKQVDAKTAQYLHNWDNSLMMYLQEARMKIENRKLLGKKSGEVPEITDKSIGRLIAERKLESSKPFTPEELGEITQILKAGIEPTGVPAWANLIKDVGYTTTLFNYFSSITQLGDIYAPLYRTPLGTLKAGVKMATGRSAVENLKRIGIDVNQIGREFTNPRQRSQFSRFMAKVSLFRWADMGMKKLAVNTYYERYRSLAKQDKLVEGHPEYYRFKQRFGDKADEVINEFKTTPKGELTSRMAFQLWDELDAHQPISRWSLPEKYHTSAAMQLGYQMKTFALRRADYILNESIRVMRNKNLSKTERIQGVKNFFNLMAVVLASEQATGVTKEFIKNLMKQGKFDLGEAFKQTYANPDMHTSILIDNLMGVILLSRYDLKTIQKDGLLSTLAAKILPITSVADNFTKDMIGGTFPKYTTKSIPLVGTALYEWLLESTKGKKGFNLNFSMPNLPNL